MHRHAPEFSLSKISFDDRDLPRKLKDKKARPKAYYAYVVKSQCVVGFAYNRNKNVDLWCGVLSGHVQASGKTQGLDLPGTGRGGRTPDEPVERLVLKAGVQYPVVRFCAPQNSQEKYAEPMNGAEEAQH